MNIQQIKQRFGIIGNHPSLNRAIEIAVQVASTDLTVLITGESGTGKEVFPQIIHQYSPRKHNNYVAVNCGAIPEGTIDSELFGHEKGSFTGATDKRKGYFEVADGGTIFLDEVGELPLSTQVRLLRVLETGEFMKVGSSKVQKTNVRVVAATNVNLPEAVKNGKFREDLYYRLNTVPITLKPLRERKEDIHLLFRKFALDFSEKYKMPAIKLTEDAVNLLINYRWPGNIRQLKNVTEQISIIEENRIVDSEILKKYLPDIENTNLPALVGGAGGVDEKTFNTEREILYQVLFDMKKDMNELKALVADILSGKIPTGMAKETPNIVNTINQPVDIDLYKEKYYPPATINKPPQQEKYKINIPEENIEDTSEYVEESLSIAEKEKELIIKALEKHNGKRKKAAQDLGISERTLYRKLKEYNIQ